MKNFKTIITIILCVCYTVINAQSKEEDQKAIAIFEIKDARDNGSDFTPNVLEENAYLVLYKSNDGEEIMLSNYWEKSKSQSFGRIYSITKEGKPDTETEYKYDLYNFQWSYSNSYDDKKGTAKIKLFVVYKPQGTYFEFTILPENLDVLVYKGTMKGDLKLLDVKIDK
ncbi:hypothetical protein [Flavobacterium aciduliphilum]|uniref:Uncharacterized protein n=1 Tax=Flavobacterium aciduliphilum TaxID=1101402 RepID=A0A328YC33_9FLAO|nr:hypothetical protein [Flavobacterium aciduliphilum]RAR71489.1 hypothetical protein CLV55_10745 [Flavobacterium aciduliphilum]